MNKRVSFKRRLSHTGIHITHVEMTWYELLRNVSVWKRQSVSISSFLHLRFLWKTAAQCFSWHELRYSPGLRKMVQTLELGYFKIILNILRVLTFSGVSLKSQFYHVLSLVDALFRFHVFILYIQNTSFSKVSDGGLKNCSHASHSPVSTQTIQFRVMFLF